MNLADVRAAFLPRKRKKRLGRGWGSGHGKTSGRGNKGQQARSGGGKGAGFEGGQMPLYRRLPKRGFNNHRFRTVYAIVNVGQLEGAFGDGSSIDVAAIRGAHLVNDKGPIKVLGGGELSKKLHITVDRFSDSAKKKIEASGGSATALEPPRPVKKPKRPFVARAPKAEPPEKAPGEPPAEKPSKEPRKEKAPKGAEKAAPEGAEPKAPKPPKDKKQPKAPPPEKGGPPSGTTL